ncbi:MAG: hypothetical protein IJT30_02720 [Muribaculaceae bacterium]|nr:hypothetical protein [Muribaculaceae bacterium]
MKHPKLRDAKHLVTNEIYELGKLPSEVITKIGGSIVYLLHTGRTDISGDDWADVFAMAVGGTHFASPVGIADVAVGKMAWSMKTVKHSNVFKCKNVRLISGRCSPDYSYGIQDPHANIAKTGQAVLAVWNERINIAYDEYNPVRVNVLVRNYDLTEFVLFEEYIERYRTVDYRWIENKNGNLIGIHKQSGRTCFTWQPHGSQFTIHSEIPNDAIKFRVRKPPIINQELALTNIGFDESWIEIL